MNSVQERQRLLLQQEAVEDKSTASHCYLEEYSEGKTARCTGLPRSVTSRGRFGFTGGSDF